MNKISKILVIALVCCICLCTMVIGVFATTNTKITMSNGVSFQAAKVEVDITGSSKYAGKTIIDHYINGVLISNNAIFSKSVGGDNSSSFKWATGYKLEGGATIPTNGNSIILDYNNPTINYEMIFRNTSHTKMTVEILPISSMNSNILMSTVMTTSFDGSYNRTRIDNLPKDVRDDTNINGIWCSATITFSIINKEVKFSDAGIGFNVKMYRTDGAI